MEPCAGIWRETNSTGGKGRGASVSAPTVHSSAIVTPMPAASHHRRRMAMTSHPLEISGTAIDCASSRRRMQP
jgi:hypothetical protein